MAQKTLIFIESNYLYLLSKFFNTKIDLFKFSYNLAKNENMEIKTVYYYTSPPFQNNPPTLEESKRKSGYDSFINKIKKSNIIIREGRCQNIEGYREKGVDTLFTIDLMNILINNLKEKDKITKVILFTCDTDFVPVIERIKQEGIIVILYYYSDFKRKSKFSMSNHILNVCNKKVLITQNFLKKSEIIKSLF
ncbi:MAG: NYN domain-containing protein [Candidatus Nanoarchaeia archaeon]|nr:NYN domain-containing protein [Candidatus Nanoarchaeia archaeon]